MPRRALARRAGGAARRARGRRRAGAVRIRQAAPPDLELDPREGDGAARRRRSSRAAAAATCCPRSAPAASGRCGWRAGTTGPAGPAEVSVYPDLVAARRLAVSVRRGQFRERGVSARGPLGLGTEFELVRDYLPDDDIRQVNWRATARLGRPMSNQYRVEQDRDLVLLVDAGRLAAAALPLAADEPRPGHRARRGARRRGGGGAGRRRVGDRCGAIAFDAEIRAALRPRRAGGAVIVRALHDLEPRLARLRLRGGVPARRGCQRAFVLILSDLLEPVAARSLAEAVPVLARRHAVVVASPADPALRAPPRRGPTLRRRRADGRGGRGGGRAPRPRARGAGAGARRAGGRSPRLRRRVRAGEVARAAVGRERASERLAACVPAWTAYLGDGAVARRRRYRLRPPSLPQPASRPRHEHQPPEQPASAEPDRTWTSTGSSGPVATPRRSRTAPARAPCRGPARRSAAPRAAASRRGARPRDDQRVPEPQAGHAADHDARELERAVRRDQADERLAVAGAEREPAEHAEQQAVENSAAAVHSPNRRPPANATERDLDVVDHHLRREHAALAGAEVAAGGGRIGRAWKSAGTSPTAAPGSASPQRRRRCGDEQQRPCERDDRRALGQPPPVAVREEVAHAAAARRAPVHGRAPARDERLQPRDDRVARKAAAGVGEVGGSAAVERTELEQAGRARAPPAAPARPPQQGVEPDPVRPPLRLETL